MARGFKLLAYLSDIRFEALRQHGESKYMDLGKWVLVVKSLTR